MAAVSFWIISVMVVTSLAVQVSSKGIGLRHRRQNEEPTTVTGGLEVTSMLPTAQSPGEEISTDEPTTQTRTSAVAVTANEDSARDACETATTPWTPWSAKWENIKDKDCGRRRRTRRIRNETLVEKCQSLGVLLSEFEEFCKSELYTGPQLRIIRKLSWTNHQITFACLRLRLRHVLLLKRCVFLAWRKHLKARMVLIITISRNVCACGV